MEEAVVQVMEEEADGDRRKSIDFKAFNRMDQYPGGEVKRGE